MAFSSVEEDGWGNKLHLVWKLPCTYDLKKELLSLPELSCPVFSPASASASSWPYAHPCTHQPPAAGCSTARVKGQELESVCVEWGDPADPPQAESSLP